MKAFRIIGIILFALLCLPFRIFHIVKEFIFPNKYDKNPTDKSEAISKAIHRKNMADIKNKLSNFNLNYTE
jgi:hypothetical protein